MRPQPQPWFAAGGELASLRGGSAADVAVPAYRSASRDA